MNSRITNDDFKKEVIQMIYLVRSYGYDEYIKTINSERDEVIPQNMIKFSNRAFKLAQNMVVVGIQAEQLEQSTAKTLRKVARRKRDKKERKS